MVLFHRSGTGSHSSRRPAREFPSYDAISSRGMTPVPTDLPYDDPSRPRAYSEGPKRLSVFGGRSRSNTVASTSSYQSPASSLISVEQLSGRSSQDDRSMSSLGMERTESVAKSLMHRGSRMLRRQNSKFSIASSLTLDEEGDGEREKYKFEVSELFQKGSKARSRSNSLAGMEIWARSSFDRSLTDCITGNGLKKSISVPFNFSHVTHTNQRQLPSLHRVSDNELVTEFSVIRASQKPKPELRGIRADDLHFKNFSSEDLPSQELTRFPSSKTSPATTPPRSRESSRQFITPPTARNSRSIENFSRPAPRSPISPTSPIAPPPRTSSRAACTPSTYEAPDPSLNEVIGSIRKVNVFDVTDPSTPENQSSLSLPTTISPDAEAVDGPIPHAVTTVDDTAKQLRPLPHSSIPPELADVPEEDETTFWQGSPGRNSRPSTGRSSLRHVQSFPSARLSFDRRPGSRQSSQTLGQSPLESPAARPPRSLGAPFETERSPTTSRGLGSAKRFSVGLKAIDGSWEDVIDYSYDHAAESSCNFDWDSKSVDEDEDVDACYTPSEDPGAPPLAEEKSRFFPGAFRPPRLDTSRLTVPDLEPTSAQSKSTTQEVVTPLHPYGSKGFAATRLSKDSDFFKAKPSLLISSAVFEDTLSQEAMYEELLSGTDQNDPRFPFYSHREEVAQSQSVSPRSSGSPISKCNSQESIILCRAASVVRKHRSSTSATSLPELIHSIRSNASHEDANATPTERTEHPTPLNQAIHKRSISQIKETAHQSLIKIDDDEKVDTHTRDRSHSVSEVAPKHMSASKITGPTIPRRNMAAAPKSGPRIGNRTSSRGNYSLFPTAAPKSPRKEVAF
jgi:hypothetical protein